MALDFPMSSGRNWDALSDSLRDLEWLPGKGYVLLFEGAGDNAAAPDALVMMGIVMASAVSCISAFMSIHYKP